MAIVLDGSNGLIIPGGSSSNPSLKSSDSDTGFYFDTSNVYLSIDGSDKASFYANGLSNFESLSVNGAIQMFANGNMSVPGSLDVAGNVAFTTTGLISFDSIQVTNGANLNGLIYPTTDGATDQVMLTDGAGNISFGDRATTGKAIAMSIVFGGS
jgi:hypothetical protein